MRDMPRLGDDHGDAHGDDIDNIDSTRDDHGTDAASDANTLAQALSQAAANEAVRAAEHAVSDAWLAELIEADRSAADTMVECRLATDTTRLTLNAALADGAIHGIITAHTALEVAIQALERSMARYEAVHALLADQCAWSAEAAAQRVIEAATDEHRVAAAMRR